MDCFARIPDPRGRRGRRHPLPVVLALVALAMAADNTAPTEIAEWVADAPQDTLAKVGARWDGWNGRYRAPDRRTVRRVLDLTDPALFDEVTCAFVAELTEHTSPRTAGTLRAIAVDGKVLRGSRTWQYRPVTLMAALEHSTGTILAQHEIDQKSNEIPQLPELLSELALTGTIITADALHTQRGTASHLLSRGAHYVFTVKSNQPALLAELHRRLTVEGESTGEHHERIRGHGRIVQRDLVAASADGLDFPGARQIARIIRTTRDLGGQKTGKEIAYIITSLPPSLATPADLAGYVRGHWRIEAHHFVRDMTFEEDASQVSTGHLPRVMATFRNLIISLLRLSGSTNLAASLRYNARRAHRPLELLRIT
jgi:predicted transposase YbfD/YdcC